MPLDHCLTVDEAASYLGITGRVVRKNAESGKYGAVRRENSNGRGGRDGQIIKIPLSGLPASIQIAYLRDHGFTHTVYRDEDDSWDREPEWKRRIAGERLQIITAWERFLAANIGSIAELTDEFVKSYYTAEPDNKLSSQTLYRWRKDYRSGGRMALIPGWGGDGKRERNIDPKAWEYFLKLFGTKQKRSISDCYFDLTYIAAENGWRIPSLRTMQRMVQEDMPETTLILLRDGEEAFRNKCEPYILRDPESVNGNQVWVGDHYWMDMFVNGRDGRPVRPWLTAWLDFRSFKLVGWVISFGPNTDTIMAAFAEGALDKSIGLPYDIYIDNGRDYSSHEFAGRGNRHKAKIVIDETVVQSLVAQLGITPHFAIPKNARAKTVERFFRIVSEKFCKRFATYCGSNNKERPEGLDDLLKSHPEQIPTIDDLKAAFKEWNNQVYNQLPSDGFGRQGETPNETFNRTRGPLRIGSEAAMRLCFMRHTQTLKVQRNGLNFWGQWYFNADLTAERLGETVYLRYRDEEMSRVFVFSMKDEFICEAELIKRLPVFGASKEDIRAAHHEAKKVKRIAAQYAQISDEIEAEPDHLTRILAKKQPEPNPPQTPNVIEPVRISKELNIAASQINRLVVGGDNCQHQSYDDRRAADRERARETMRAISRSMSMPK
jgi:hypothetical protein